MIAIGVGALLLGSAAPALATPAATSAGGAPPVADTRVAKDTVAFLGDSVAAGVGAGPLDGTPYASDCDRTTSAYGYRVADLLGSTAVVLACTDATSQDGLLGPEGPVPAQLAQLRALPRRPAAVVVTIGANDVQYAQFFRNCLDPDPAHDCATAANTQRFKQLLSRVAAPGLRQVLNELVDRRRRQTVVLTGLYDPFGPLAGPVFHLQPDEIDWYRARLAELNRMLAEQARHLHIGFVPLTSLTAERGDIDVDPAARGFLHPTDQGQRVIAALVAARIRASRGPR